MFLKNELKTSSNYQGREVRDLLKNNFTAKTPKKNVFIF